MSGPSHDKPHDKQFFDTFMLVLGILILVAFALYFGAKAIAARTQEAQALEDPLLQQAVAERIKPIGQLAISGSDNSALEEKSAAAPVAAAMRELSGEQLYRSTCMTCHGPGIAGAPKFGDKALWAPRIAQGMETLHKHALEGFTGTAGTMPMKGTAMDVSDKSIVAAVDYMVSQAKN